ncbi:hypothetical protein SAMN05444287_0113 [Octadecabacter temperatus]|uniref:Uncharacterized protein n=1 Tax=Octadecabacter temperatus TaxID=1458307 RepID=A0A0K0Y265_9RHOB|nr:hypothetical protein [Octadecabacter temperatus]AKS45025.1 hypothetical protein OSB_04620 [Octadecabacter temperatus]SIN84705.1 hypothetical protein SAMN05444287_0113 [Octadecabacter temperatus]
MTEFEHWLWPAILLVLLWLIFTAVRRLQRDLEVITKTVQTIRQVQTRRSAEYMLIENELSTLLSCMIESSNDEETREKLLKVAQDRHSRLRSRIEHGTGSSEHLRGLELPLEEDDPWFNSDVAEMMVPEAFLKEDK